MDGYVKQELAENTSLKNKLDKIEIFTGEKNNTQGVAQRIHGVPDIITIPVVVHVLYHTPDQKISQATIDLLIGALNRDFNKRNFDTVNTPDRFKPYAAAMGFEFKLATMDPA